MKYIIDQKILSGDQRLYLENFEMRLRQIVAKSLDNIFDLSVSPSWKVLPRGDVFFKKTDNADFSINNSLSVDAIIDSFIKNNLVVDFPECTLHLDVQYKIKRVSNDGDKRSEPVEEGKTDEGLPTFIPQTPRYSFDQIILSDEIRTRIYNDLNTIKHQDLIYNQWGFSEVDSKPKSILNFFGPPGTGKTMCAHAIAKMLDKPLLALNYSEIESKYVGDAAKNLKKAFDTASEIGAVMFFDEADSFLGKRIENVSHGSDQALNSLRSQMLILLEEFEGVVLFATNLVTNFDKAFESRILDHIKLDLPNREARAEIISKMLPSRLPLDHPFSNEELLEASDIIDGFAGREIKSAILTMLLDKAGEEGERIISFDDLKNALIKKKEQIETLKKEESERRKSRIIKKIEEKIEEENVIENHKKKNKKKRKR